MHSLIQTQWGNPVASHVEMLGVQEELAILKGAP
jgi:hypothetical protein